MSVNYCDSADLLPENPYFKKKTPFNIDND